MARRPDIAQRVHRARRPPIDCFYVYPTVSTQPTPIANRHIDPEEKAIAVNQAARFSQVCRVFAPVYRQLTLAAINGAVPVTAAQQARAFGDVRAAWRDYLAHHNHGRGVVLIGHSQGTFMLTRLIREAIDKRPAVRRRVVSALLLGGNVQVPVGRDAGGDFRHLPACRSRSRLHCVVAYSSFDQPPPADSLFGRVPGSSTRQVLCVNPAAPAGGAAVLHPYFTTSPFPGPIGQVAVPVPQAPTPWVSFPGLYRAHCVQAGGASWLQIDDIGPPGDTRVRVGDTLGPTQGLHLADVQLALGDLVALVRHQAAAFVHRAR